jgi:alpha-glucoside transport system permease protein
VQQRANDPMTRQITNLLGQYGSEWHLLAAGAFVIMLVPLAVFFALQRYFVEGILAGSVK